LDLKNSNGLVPAYSLVLVTDRSRERAKYGVRVFLVATSPLPALCVEDLNLNGRYVRMKGGG